MKQTLKPVIRSCKYKAEVILKDWKNKLVTSRIGMHQQEMEMLQRGVQQLRNKLAAVDAQMGQICSGNVRCDIPWSN